jgi:tripartite ATP-independent transporter DctP family solute receptor
MGMKFSHTRKVTAVTMAVGLTALSTACSVGAGGSSGSSAAGEEGSQTLLLGHGADPGNPRTIAADAFAEQVSEETDGRITVQVQGSEQLGDDSEMLQSVKGGTLDLTANSQGPMAGFVPEVALIGLPFLFDDSEEAYSVIDGEVGDELAALAEEQGFKVLAWWDNGIRHITNSKRPIESPQDVAGLKIRTPEDPMTVDIFSTLNANPTPLDFGELYLALRQGTVDGQENPLTNIASAKLYEVQDHLALSGHKVEVTPFVMNLDTWNALTPEDQEVIKQAAEDARDQQRQLMQEQNAELEDTLAQDMQVTEPDKDAFRQATKGVYEKWAKKYPELVDQLEQAAGS